MNKAEQTRAFLPQNSQKEKTEVFATAAKKDILKTVARAVRVISLPPLAITALLCILLRTKSSAFETNLQALLCFFFLALTPTLAYPVSYLVPRFRAGKRRVQRKLAFFFSLVGYAGGFLYGILSDAAPLAKIIYASYFFSVILLSLCNLLHLRASGHAAGMVGAVLFAAVALGGISVPFGILFYAAVLWASLYTKRHTVAEFLTGTAVSLLSAFVAFLVF